MDYRRADDQLFGKYCYIDTPWIAGKKTIYRIIRSGVRSNTWCEVPIKFRDEPVTHNHSEDIVYVVLDTLIDENTKIKRFALKDIEIIEVADRKTEPQVVEKCDRPQMDCENCWKQLHCRVKDEPQYHADVECNYKDCDNCGHKEYCPQSKTKPQTDE